MAQRLPFPDVIPVDSEKRNEAVFVSHDEALYAADGIVDSFRTVDEHYIADRESRLKFMADSVFKMRVPGSLGIPAGIHGSLEFDERNIDSKELLVIISPLNDGPPHSSAKTMAHYVETESPDTTHTRIAQPNSWSPATKLDIGYEFLNVEGLNMPVLQIFSRVPPRALQLKERARLLKDGDSSGFGRIAYEGIDYADRELRWHGGSGIEKVHMFGAGMAHNAIAAAHYLARNQDDYEVGSFTAMNLILGEKVLGMMRDYSVRPHTGEAAKIILPPDYVRIAEPIMRREIDGKGAEFAMRWRQLRAMLDISYMLALKRPGPTAQAIEDLMDEGITGTVANAHNSSMTARTRGFLPAGNAGLNLIDIVGVEGKKVGMMANEQAGLVAIIMAQGIKNSQPSPRA